MAEIKLNKVGRFYKLDSKLVEKIDAHSATSGTRKEAIIEKALTRFFKHLKK